MVKAFNTIFASHQSDPVVDDLQLDGFVAGDDDVAKEQVLALVASLGFRPIDTGPLAMARALEGMGMLNISLNMITNGRGRLGGSFSVQPVSGAAPGRGRGQGSIAPRSVSYGAASRRTNVPNAG